MNLTKKQMQALKKGKLVDVTVLVNIPRKAKSIEYLNKNKWSYFSPDDNCGKIFRAKYEQGKKIRLSCEGFQDVIGRLAGVMPKPKDKRWCFVYSVKLLDAHV